MESINVVIDDAILEMIVDESGDVTNLKNNDDGNISQDSDVQKQSLKKGIYSYSIEKRYKVISSAIKSSHSTGGATSYISWWWGIYFKKTIVKSEFESSQKQHNWGFGWGYLSKKKNKL